MEPYKDFLQDIHNAPRHKHKALVTRYIRENPKDITAYYRLSFAMGELAIETRVTFLLRILQFKDVDTNYENAIETMIIYLMPSNPKKTEVTILESFLEKLDEWFTDHPNIQKSPRIRLQIEAIRFKIKCQSLTPREAFELGLSNCVDFFFNQEDGIHLYAFRQLTYLCQYQIRENDLPDLVRLLISMVHWKLRMNPNHPNHRDVDGFSDLLSDFEYPIMRLGREVIAYLMTKGQYRSSLLLLRECMIDYENGELSARFLCLVYWELSEHPKSLVKKDITKVTELLSKLHLSILIDDFKIKVSNQKLTIAEALQDINIQYTNDTDDLKKNCLKVLETDVSNLDINTSFDKSLKQEWQRIVTEVINCLK